MYNTMDVHDNCLTFESSARISDNQVRSKNILVYKFIHSIELVPIS